MDLNDVLDWADDILSHECSDDSVSAEEERIARVIKEEYNRGVKEKLD